MCTAQYPVGPNIMAQPRTKSNNPQDCNNGTRWQFIEDGSDWDVTYINTFSFPLGIAQGGAIRAISPCRTPSSWEKTLAGLSRAKAVFPGQLAAGSTFIRIVSPVTDPTLYPNFNSYLASAFSGPGGPNPPSTSAMSTTAPRTRCLRQPPSSTTAPGDPPGGVLPSTLCDRSVTYRNVLRPSPKLDGDQRRPGEELENSSSPRP